jgi:hypothetical protein
MNCSIDVFTDIIAKLHNNWSNLWSQFLSEYGPLKDGFSFGSCYTSCGSLGFSSVTGLDGLTLNTTGPPVGPTDGPTVFFTTCNIEDQAILVVPMEPQPIELQSILRATGFNQVWPTGSINHTLYASITGFLLITVPRSKNTLYYSRPLVDISFFINWTTDTNGNIGGFPEQTSPLFPTIPKDKLLYNFEKVLKDGARSKLLGPIFRDLQSNDKSFTCKWPILIKQACTTSTSALQGPCNPCDTCCKCLAQQRCDGECSGCECVRCSPSIWRYQTALCAILMLFISILLTEYLFRKYVKL